MSPRARNLYVPGGETPFKISRTKIELFRECPRCFYFDRRLGVSRPSGPPFTLNAAVDALLKQEFDVLRAKGKKHPLMEAYGVDAIPAPHANLNEWRANFTGVQFLHRPTNLLVFGAIDDLWINSKKEYMVVDYKATAKAEVVRSLDQTSFRDQYRRQMEVYQWLLRNNGLAVSDTGYFVYCTGRADRAAFDGKLEFEVCVIPSEGKDDWVEPTIIELKKCLDGPVPESADACDYCAYRRDARVFEK
jgi:hypothetical protein